ncbi:hypothetical protein H8959_019182 [Pygathrix nigripes]
MSPLLCVQKSLGQVPGGVPLGGFSSWGYGYLVSRGSPRNLRNEASLICARVPFLPAGGLISQAVGSLLPPGVFVSAAQS